MKITTGIPVADRETAAILYWEAFRGKLGFVMGPRYRALLFIKKVMRPDHGICAHDADGRLLGVAGFKTNQGALVGGTFTDLRQVYGLVGACWRALLLSMLERDTENERFLMDGIFVSENARGQGVGTTLLHAIAAEAKVRGFDQVRLDVIDKNTRARDLYLQEGFRVVQHQKVGPLRLIFGFSGVTTMVREL